MNLFCVLLILSISLLSKPGSFAGRNDVRHPNSSFAFTGLPPQKQIPVLCYHNIKPVIKGNSPEYTIDAERFNEHIKMLRDSGYTTILPDKLTNYLTTGKALPSKSIMITFDDSHEEHFSIAAPILQRAGFIGVFFIMTVTIEKHLYLTGSQIKELSDSGHIIAGHTWNHPNVNKLKEEDWDLQISVPKEKLEELTGKPVWYFAYPYGAWNEKAINELKKRGVKAAFQLSEKQSQKDPLYTIRRLMVDGRWPASMLFKKIKSNF